MKLGMMFNRSITIGDMPITRLSTTPVVHVVQPRLEPPATKNLSTVFPPPSSLFMNAVTVSIARTAAFVIGSRNGHDTSPVSRYFRHV